jgi:3-deoxy-manno-octulosonate cytidylyltransferase (CMP-KDO synthetase)
MKKVIIIPARYGSTRLPGKPLAQLWGKPLIQHVYERAVNSGIEAYVATDHEEVFKTVESFGGKAVMTSPEHKCGTDRIAEAVSILGLEEEDIVINLQGDQPLFPPEYFAPLIEPLLKNEAEMSTLATPFKSLSEVENPNRVKVVLDAKGRALYFSRSPIPYIRDKTSEFPYLKHIGVYGYRVRFLKEFVSLPEGRLERLEKLEQLRALEHGYAIAVRVVEADFPEVDTPEDLEALEKRGKR